ncbi:MAG TPA: pyridoxamine 5'-phosphate oxidase family protein [Spirochaetota bacterium]|nr:pyridoxamine 5'-phosphate oxidase family protein [Spirochaetota bacterium]HPS86837.1 pyridoxamine 5'-phosphate oxidase family protein [Spirochaetota bacterium]
MPVEWLSEEKCRKMLGPQVYGRLATSGKDNVPYITPVNYAYANDAIYIHCALKGRKLNNIAENPVVCFEISAPGNLYISEKACGFSMRYWSILISGKAELVESIDEKREALNAVMQKYAGRFEYSDPSDEDLGKVNVIKINIGNISGKMGIDPQ